MAQEHGDDVYMTFHLVENGNTVTRRVHFMLVQSAVDGLLRYYEGKLLPDEITLFTGKPHKGRHFAECFPGSPQPEASWSPPKTECWPTRRDVLHLAIGIGILLALRFIGTAGQVVM